MFCRKIRFLFKAVCLNYLKLNWFNYLVIGILALYDLNMATTRLVSLILQTLSEAHKTLKDYKERKRKRLEFSRSKQTK